MFQTRFKEWLSAVPGLAEEFDAFYARLNAFLNVSFNADGTLISPAHTSISQLGFPVGVYMPFGGTTAPSGWLLCDGTAYNRAIYKTLFDVIGTAFGSGDGATTFNVPDMRGKAPYGVASSGTGSTLGGSFGAMDHTHTGPSHTHTSTTVNVTVSGAQAVATSPTNAAGAGNTGTANPPGVASNFIICAS